MIFFIHKHKEAMIYMGKFVETKLKKNQKLNYMNKKTKKTVFFCLFYLFLFNFFLILFRQNFLNIASLSSLKY